MRPISGKSASNRGCLPAKVLIRCSIRTSRASSPSELLEQLGLERVDARPSFREPLEYQALG